MSTTARHLRAVPRRRETEEERREAELAGALASAKAAEGDPAAWLAVCTSVTRELAAYLRIAVGDASARMELDEDGHPWLYAYEPSADAVMKDPAPVTPDNEYQLPRECSTGTAYALHQWVADQLRYAEVLAA